MKFILAILLALVAPAWGVEREPGCRMLDPAVSQMIVTRPVSTGSHQADPALEFGWHKVEPIKPVNVAKLGKTLADIESRMPDGHIYRDRDMITWAHETTHGINSRVRVAAGAGINALYCLDGYVGIFREPNVRKSTVCRYVPAELRGDVWGLYMTGQSAWENQPLYILDEWVAYINGATCGIELMANGGIGNRSLEHDVIHAIEFCGYATALMVAIDAHDPNYPDKAPLTEFVAWNIKRAINVTQNHATGHVQKFAAQCVDGSCSSGNCPPLAWGGGRWRPAQPQQPPMKPVPPKPNPPAVATTPPKGCTCDGKGDCQCDPASACKCDNGLAALVKAMAAKVEHFEQLERDIAANPAQYKGPKGDPGDKGDPGEQGPKGDKGDGDPMVEAPANDSKTPVYWNIRARKKK